MTDYSAQDWERLGRAVKRSRMNSPELSSTKIWAARIGRSSRTLLGLERGEPVGDATLFRIENELNWPEGYSWKILDGSAIREEAPSMAWIDEPEHIDLEQVSTAELLGEVARRVGILERGDLNEIDDSTVTWLQSRARARARAPHQDDVPQAAMEARPGDTPPGQSEEPDA